MDGAMRGCWRCGWSISRVWMLSCATMTVTSNTSAAMQAPGGRAELRPAAAGAVSLDAVTLGKVCHMTLRDDSQRSNAAAVFTRMLPGAPWDSVQFAALPNDVPAGVRASVMTAPGSDPLVYWRGALEGAELLHELVHAWQGMLSDERFAALLQTLHSRDARAGFSAAVVERATVSVVESLTWMVRDAGGSERARRLVERMATVDPGRPGALALRGDALVDLIAGRDWNGARVVLTRSLSSRQVDTRTQRDWATWARIFFLLEAQAYDAQARCATGWTAVE